jgi:hypothetical protein
MPLARYFFCVGAALLALLFAIDAGSSKFDAGPAKLAAAESTAAVSDVPAQRIHSDRKWPERVVFDTSMPTIVPAQVIAAKPDVAVQSALAEISAKTRVRETFAQFRPEDEKKPVAKSPPKRKIAKPRDVRPMMLVEQQPRFGLFNTW